MAFYSPGLNQFSRAARCRTFGFFEFEVAAFLSSHVPGFFLVSGLASMSFATSFRYILVS
jgi:hypothetical protein